MSALSPLSRLHSQVSLPLPFGVLLVLLQYPLFSYSYSWHFKEKPSQCGDVTIEISGTDGKPPYRALVIPYSVTPLSTNKEVRTILDIPFDEGTTSLTFKLKYPQDSQYVAVISDANGFGTGGVSAAGRVAGSEDSSCFDPTKDVISPFYFDLEPRNQLNQCGNTRLFWQKDQVQGQTQFHGVIPGGQAFTIPQANITDIPSYGTGFTWKANLKTGTTVLIVAGDARGINTGGSALLLVGNDASGDASCLDSSSPSSTPGSPAGGSYPTGTLSPNDGNPISSGAGTNVGAIVGGVVGGLVVIVSLLLAIFFYRRRQKSKHRQREKPMDLLNEGDDEEGDANNRESRNDLPQFYRPEPFTVPDPTLASTYDGHTEDGTRPLSGTATSFYTRSGTPDGSVALGYVVGNAAGGAAGAAAASSTGTGRKGQPPRAMRPVNIIQHDDAGPSLPPKEEEAETIELPPAYTAIRTNSDQNQRDPPPA